MRARVIPVRNHCRFAQWIDFYLQILKKYISAEFVLVIVWKNGVFLNIHAGNHRNELFEMRIVIRDLLIFFYLFLAKCGGFNL